MKPKVVGRTSGRGIYGYVSLRWTKDVSAPLSGAVPGADGAQRDELVAKAGVRYGTSVLARRKLSRAYRFTHLPSALLVGNKSRMEDSHRAWRSK